MDQKRPISDHAPGAAAPLGVAELIDLLQEGLAPSEEATATALQRIMPEAVAHGRRIIAQTVGFLQQREAAAALVERWLFDPPPYVLTGPGMDTAFRAGYRAAACELASALRVAVDPGVCTHPDRDGQFCPTCGTDFRPRAASSERPSKGRAQDQKTEPK